MRRIPVYVKYWGENEFLRCPYRVVLSKRKCLFATVVFCILLVINNDEGVRSLVRESYESENWSYESGSK